MIRKKLIELMFIGLLASMMPQKSNAGFLDHENAVRQIALIGASLVIASGGTYLVSKKSKGFFNKLLSTAGGALMIGAGITGIVLSKAILDTIDECIAQANNKC